MRKSIITAAVAAVLAISFSNSEASIFSNNSNQTENELIGGLGPMQGVLAESISFFKDGERVAENKPAASKATRNFLKMGRTCVQDFSKYAKEKTLTKRVNAFAAVQVQSIVNDPQFPAKRDALVACLQKVLQKLDPIVKAPPVNPAARNAITVQLFLRFVSILDGIFNAIQAAPVTPVYTPGASTPVNYGTPTYNYGAPAPAAPAPAPAAPAGRGRR